MVSILKKIHPEATLVGQKAFHTCGNAIGRAIDPCSLKSKVLRGTHADSGTKNLGLAAMVLLRPGIGDLSETPTACGIAEKNHRNLGFYFVRQH
jgi:hypothetical protein